MNCLHYRNSEGKSIAMVEKKMKAKARWKVCSERVRERERKREGLIYLVWNSNKLID